MASKLVTPFGTDNIFIAEDSSMVQGDIKIIEKVVDTLIVEFDQSAYKEYVSSPSRCLDLSRAHRRIKIQGPT